MLCCSRFILSFLTSTALLVPCTLPRATAQAAMRGQVTSVSQLADVQPTDWAFQALQSLVERYGCISSYPDQLFRGQRSLTRYEFAAGLSACLESINQQLASATPDLVPLEDWQNWQRLQQEFATELATLRGQIVSLEARSTSLETQQFSTTTKLTGQALVSVNGGGFAGDNIIDSAGRVLADQNLNPTLLYRASLDLNTSFIGSDLLKIRMDTGSNGANDNVTGILEPNFGSVLDYSVKPPSDGNIGIGRLYYTFQPRQNLTISLGPNIRTTDYVDRNSYANTSFRDFSTQALINNFILFPINGPSTGAAINWDVGNFSLRALYAAANAANPDSQQTIRGTSSFTRVLYPNSVSNPLGLGDRGLFGDTYQGMLEVEYAPSSNLAIRLQYSGGEVFDNRFDVFGLNAEVRLAPGIALFGRYGIGTYHNTAFGDVNLDYWMAGIAFPDLFKRGAIAGIAAAQPMIATEIGNATQTNFEAFYNFSINDAIRITPTLQVITNAGNQDTNGTIITGTVRTVFLF
ncbi:MAG TPA: carbohydrate porin [Leptolyngbyaceae cyanobacterium M33_DOE_097]|uniref:S-layer protein n=1 Tax=Oscillatoriales cyanobacterium SpSt-418 TaxID=2282169 RepID=A0A7C3KAK0_9CYAN|nr:carbohydrate porin [Leptolyngbyaceae cyanobacterium M33_DOE_097]